MSNQTIDNKVLVIGGAGFIGCYLCERLLKEGCFVVCLDNLMRGKVSNIASLLNDKKFAFINGDANDFRLLVKLIKDNGINYIFHLAANSDIQASASDPQIEFECTASTTWNILNSMRLTGVKKMFFASTSAVYGELRGRDCFRETDCLEPISYYGSAKMASEAFIKSFSYMNDFDALIFRFPNVIGPKLTHGVFYDFISRLKKNPSELVVLGNGKQSKPYMHVYDLVDAILQFCWSNKGVSIFNVGVETSTTVKSIAEMVVEKMGLTDCKIIYGSSDSGWKGDVPVFSYCLDKIHKQGWKAFMTSDDAARKTIEEALYDNK